MTAPHLSRPATRRPRRAAPLPEWEAPYLPWFSASALENDWPPGWLPQEDAPKFTEQMKINLALGTPAARESAARWGAKGE